MRFRKPSPALVIACLALFTSLGGGAYAALKLPRNSVGTKQLRSNAVTSSKVRNHSLLAKDFRSGQLPQGPAGAAGQTGPAGPKGDRGDQGPPGPSSGPAGGDLSGSYPNPSLAAGAVTPSNMALVPAVRVTKSANQSVANSSESTLTFDTEAYDTDGMHSGSGSSLTAPIAGIYTISADVVWNGNSTGARVLLLQKNGSGIAQSVIAASPAFNGSQSATTDAKLSAGDTVSVDVLQTSGAALDVVPAFGATSLAMHWVGPSS